MTDNQSFSRDAQDYMDGESRGPLNDRERERAGRMLNAVNSYRAGLVPPDATLDDAVLASIRGRAPARNRAAWRWLFEPRPIRFRPVWVPVMAAAAALVIWLGVRPTSEVGGGTSTGSGVSLVSDNVFVRFQVSAPDASTVSVAGSFSAWEADAHRMERENGGLWSVTLALPLGEHQYQFVIDGERWVPDPRAHAQVDDGFGGMNSVVIVGPRGVVQS